MTHEWRPIATGRLHCDKEMLTLDGTDRYVAILENFGSGWYANAIPPHADGTSSMIPGMVRRRNRGDDLEDARAWCERVCGLHPLRPGALRSEGKS